VTDTSPPAGPAWLVKTRGLHEHIFASKTDRAQPGMTIPGLQLLLTPGNCIMQADTSADLLAQQTIGVLQPGYRTLNSRPGCKQTGRTEQHHRHTAAL